MHFTKTIAFAILAAVAEAGKGENTFAVLRFRGKDLTSGRMDPIVNPGQPSGHVHLIQGGNAFALDMDDDTAYKSTCTSAMINNDLSNYWTPTLYFKDPKTGELESVEFFYQNVYYFFDAEKEEVHPFPKGLRMFVGDPNARTPPSVPNNYYDHARGPIQPIQWTCPRGDKSQRLYPTSSNGLKGVGIQDPSNEGQGVGFPDKECDGYASPLRADIHFPSCYNPAKGVRNYKENMEYPTNGLCPEGMVHVPHLFYEVYWDTLKFKDRWTKGQGVSPWVLSNGDPTGYSLHADFINGWDDNTLQAIIDTCNAKSSGMDKCPNVPGGITTSGECHIDNLVPETIFGKMSKLPGGNSIGQWGVDASGGGGGGGSAAPPTKPTTSKATNSAPAPTTSKAAPIKSTASSKPVSSNPNNPIGPIRVPTKAASSLASAPPKPTSGPSEPVAGSPPADGVVTSYVSEETVVWTTVTLPPPSATGTPESNIAAGWGYKGCFSDKTFERALSGIEFANIGHKQVTNTKCVNYCSSRGFSLAGTEFGGQCFCGNELKGSKSIGEETCNMPCEGDASQKCGGGLALTVFEGKPKKMVRRASHFHRHMHAHSY